MDYPTENVKSFLQDGGAGNKFYSYWNIHSDVDATKDRFASFEAC